LSSRPSILVLLLGIVATTLSPPAVLATDPIATPSAAPTPSTAPAPTTVPVPTTAPIPTSTPAPIASNAPGSITLADGTVLPPMPEGTEPSVHAEMLSDHSDDQIEFGLGGEPTILRSGEGRILSEADAAGPSIMSTPEAGVGAIAGLPPGMQKEVLGFLPYWMLSDSTLSEMNYQLVSTVAYFSVGALSNGTLDKGTSTAPSTGWAGWTSPQMTSVIDRAHAAGGKVVLTVTMMAWTGDSFDRMRTLLNSSTYRSRLVTQIVDAVRLRGADGVNLDFELVPSDLRAQYTAFVRQLKAALVAAGVGRYLTVCTTGGAASWATGYDVAGLTAAGAADAIFVMGYDFHWSGSARAGGVAPIDSPYVLDVSSALSDFLEQAPASKIIWGVPYYGRGWNTTTNQLNGLTTGGSFSYYYTGHLRDAAKYGRLWDSVGKVPWYRFWDSSKASWVQVYYDDAASLAVKYDLVNRHRLAGTGMWTLLMDGSRDELWRLLAEKFVNDTTPPAGGVRVLAQTTDMSAIYVSWHAIDYQSGLDRYNVQVRDRASTTWRSWLTGTRATGAYYIGNPGTVYEFRVQAIDWKGNAQPWLVAPGKAASIRPGTFGMVRASLLNVRSGAGTGYAIVDTVDAGDRVYVMSGPVSANGYSWFQVQHGFAEWPSAEYPLIGWVALGSSTDAYVVPAYAPGVTRLQPWITGYAPKLRAFSPNGDGLRDAVAVAYALPAAASLRVDVVDTANRLVRRIDLGGKAAGAGSASWDGLTSSGAQAPAGRYLIKLFATDASGTTHAAPVAGYATNVMTQWGVTIDRQPPVVVGVEPQSGSTMLPASAEMHVRLSEEMTGVTSATVRLRDTGGSLVPTRLAWNAGSLSLTVTPESALTPGTIYTLELDGLIDVAGNRLPAWSGQFGVAPGEAFEPWLRVRVAAGTHTGYEIGNGGSLLASLPLTLSRESGAYVSQRATLPNLPGRWLYVENGAWARMWLPESPRASLAGHVEESAVPLTTRLSFVADTHTGYRFRADGSILATHSVTLSRPSGANVGARAIINGQPHWWVLNGAWAGWWMPESARAHQAGFVDRMTFAAGPRISLRAGTYTGYRFDSAGRRLESRTATLTRASGAPVSGWAVVNGRAHYLVADGIWENTWLPIDNRVTLGP
jgi:spore germination protein YaaH